MKRDPRKRINPPPPKVAKGYTHRGRVAFSLYLDEDTAKEVQDFAVLHRTTFNEAVRTLMQWGLLDYRADGVSYTLPDPT